MKKSKSIVMISGFLLLAVTTLFSVIYLSNRYLTASVKTTESAKCQGQHDTHTITIENDKMTPDHLQASLCDTLTVTNKDSKARDMSFGEHDHHLSYDGVTQKVLKKNGSMTIALKQTGTYKLHDHLQDEVAGNFTVIE